MLNNTNKKVFLNHKFSIPTNNSSNLSRPRLLKILEDRKPEQWLSLSAPAGFGKTSLVADWVSKIDADKVWLSLEETDNQTVEFWLAMVNAFYYQGYPTVTHKELASSLRDEVGSYEWINQFFNEIYLLARKNNRSIILVLDDLHHIDSHSIISNLARVRRFLTPEIGLVLISRNAIPSSIQPPNTGIEKVELSAQDLVFTIEECSAYARACLASTQCELGDPHRQNLFNEKVRAIWSQTDGWPVFANLAIQRWKAVGIGKKSAINLLEQDDICHYLEEIIFEPLAQKIKESLIKIAPYQAVNDVFCDDCMSTLIDFRALKKQTGILIPIEDSLGFYRIRKPLKEYLLRLWRAQGAEESHAEFDSAYTWYIERKMVFEAVTLCIEYSYWILAVTLIEKESRRLLSSDRWSEINAWFVKLPESVILDRPAVLVFLSWKYLYQCKLDLATKFLQLARTFLENNQQHRDERYAQSGKAELENDIARVDDCLKTLQGDFTASPNLPQPSHAACSSQEKITFALIDGLNSLYQCQLGSAQSRLESVLKRAIAEDSRSVVQKSLSALGWICYLTGDFDRLHTIIGSVKASISNDRDMIATVSNGALAMSLLEKGDTVTARAFLHDLALQQDPDAPVDIRFMLLIMRVCIHIQREEYDAATRLLDDLEILSFELPESILQCFYSVPGLKVEIHLRQGQVEEALFLAELLPADNKVNTVRYQHECLVKADALLANGHNQQSLSTLAFCQESSWEVGNQLLLLRATILESVAFQYRNNTDKAIVSFRKAILLGKQMKSINSFMRNTAQMICLLKRAQEQFRYPQYLGKLVSELSSDMCEQSAEICKLSALSKREREVLELMATGISNPEIARTMCRSLGTVKIHVHNIYKKLGASNRVTAINKFAAVTA